MLQGPPAAGEQGEPALAEAAQGALDGVAGAGVNIEECSPHLQVGEGEPLSERQGLI